MKYMSKLMIYQHNNSWIYHVVCPMGYMVPTGCLQDEQYGTYAQIHQLTIAMLLYILYNI